MKRILGLGLVLAACHGEAWTPVATRDTKDDPAKVRPGYGNSELHLWMPLGETELATIKEVELARQGDAHALLDWALVASGDQRETAAFAQYRQRVDAFVTELKPTIDAADDWHKGFEINRAMHRVFFAQTSDLGGYLLGQARLTGIFTGGKYNCISSTLLYLVLARSFGMPVHGVLTHIHAFVEYDPPGKTLEVETTSLTGFDWVHDERYFREGAKDWSKDRGLEPLSLEDYKKRQIMDPYALIAVEMADDRLGNDDLDRKRLREIAVVLAPEIPDVQKHAVYVWAKDANDLYDAKQWNTIVKLFDTVGATIAMVNDKTKDPEVKESIAWLRVYYAQALINVRRPDHAIAMMDEGLKTFDPKWKDADKIKKGLLWILIDQLQDSMHRKDYAAALALIRPRFEACRNHQDCAESLGVIYHNQFVEQWNSGNKKAARETIDECVKLVPLAKDCKSDMSEFFGE